MQTIQPIDISDFSGGLNTRDGAGGIADNEYADALNVYLVQRGIAKRKGFERYMAGRISTTAAGTSITDANFVSAGQKIVGTAGTKINYKNGTSWADITGSVTLTAAYPIITTMIDDNLVGVNGQNPPWYWAGSSNAATLAGDNIPTAPVACETYQGRLFLTDGRTLRWGGYMGEWQSFYTDNNQTFNSAIKGLKVYGDSNSSYLIVLCDRGVYVCNFDPESVQVGGRGVFTFDQISAQHGCISPASVQECYVPTLGLCVVWADYDGIKLYHPSLGIDKVSDKIRDDWETFELGSASKFVSAFYRPKGWYILSVIDDGSTTCDKQIIFDLYNSKPAAESPDKRWVIASFFDLNLTAVNVIRESGVEKLVGSDSTGYWNRYDYGQNDNTAAIDGCFKTKAFGDPYTEKGFISATLVYAYYGAYDFDITMYYDSHADTYDTTHTAKAYGQRLGEFILDQDVLVGEGDLVISAEEIKGWGRMAQVKMRNTEADQPFRIHRLLLNYRPGRVVLAR